MTTPEHTLVGIHLGFSLGWHRRYGGKSILLAAVASNLPDWDGIPMLFDMARFEAGHRVWGHSLLVILIVSILIALLQRRTDFLGRVWDWLQARIQLPQAQHAPSGDAPRRVLSVAATCLVACVAQVMHLPCDMVVSGGAGLSDWAVQPFWPFSSLGCVFPMIPWGDFGPTLILMGGVILQARLPERLTLISWGTIGILVGYLCVRWGMQ